jgi:hypothetical protein
VPSARIDPPEDSCTDHATAVSLDPKTAAWNFCEAPGGTTALDGDTATRTPTVTIVPGTPGAQAAASTSSSGSPIRRKCINDLSLGLASCEPVHRKEPPLRESLLVNNRAAREGGSHLRSRKCGPVIDVVQIELLQISMTLDGGRAQIACTVCGAVAGIPATRQRLSEALCHVRLHEQ